MAKATNSISTTIRVRLPRELLVVIEEWATAHNLPRSKAIRALLLRGLAWEEAQQKLAA
jgi:predicted DNA binding CopG/RHH family protein